MTYYRDGIGTEACSLIAGHMVVCSYLGGAARCNGKMGGFCASRWGEVVDEYLLRGLDGMFRSSWRSRKRAGTRLQ